jgi:hypothetical protein
MTIPRWWNVLAALAVLAGGADAGLIVPIDCWPSVGAEPDPLPPISEYVTFNPYQPPMIILYDPAHWPDDGGWLPDPVANEWELEPLGENEYLEDLMLHWLYLEDPRGMDWIRLGNNYTFGL